MKVDFRLENGIILSLFRIKYQLSLTCINLINLLDSRFFFGVGYWKQSDYFNS